MTGAELLGRMYWREVERVTGRLVRARERKGSLELRLLGRGPALLRFGQPTLEATNTLARCRYPIEGGLLAQRPAGGRLWGAVSTEHERDPLPEFADFAAPLAKVTDPRFLHAREEGRTLEIPAAVSIALA